jgi:hypothetical protein
MDGDHARLAAGVEEAIDELAAALAPQGKGPGAVPARRSAKMPVGGQRSPPPKVESSLHGHPVP